MMANLERTDVLFYCHDGRGIGHVSRTVAIALALRRLAPKLRILILTGSEWVSSLVGHTPIDWLKLPSYRSVFRNGIGKGSQGPLGYNEADLAVLRGALISDIIKRFRPRVVVVDHYADGKNGELRPALIETRVTDSRWLLGLRTVVGTGSRVWNSTTRAIVADYYSTVLWYGDTEVVGMGEYNRIKGKFSGTPIVETGYVSRAVELSRIGAVSLDHPSDAVAAFTWCSAESVAVIGSLARLLDPPVFPRWHVSLGPIIDGEKRYTLPPELLRSQQFVVTPPGFAFLGALKAATIAVLHAGYNSLTDAAWAGVPSVIIVRQTADEEQCRHVQQLKSRMERTVTFMSESEAADPDGLRRALCERAAKDNGERISPIELDGATTAAIKVLDQLGGDHGRLCGA